MEKSAATLPRQPIGLTALEDAIARLGGVTKFAKSIGASYQLVQGWRDSERRFAAPAEYCPAIERATDGAVRCEDLRPDVEWGVLRTGTPDPVPRAATVAEVRG
jgi:DNA-binding transcriptional regulator YdaS (Cro superfamily)